MNYPQSQEILNEIDKAKKILVNLHRGPDLDSFACAFSLYYFLCSLNKEVDVVLTKTSRVSKQISSLEESKLVELVDFAKLDMENYDLFITADSDGWQQIVDNSEVKLPNIPIVVIDHHESNDKFGSINLIDNSAVSCSQIIYLLFKDWDFPIDRLTAELLLIGIIADSGVFAFSNDSKAMRIAADLMELGADKVKIINKLFKTQTFEQVRAWGEYLTRFQIDSEYKFVWCAISYEDFKKYRIPAKAATMVATQFSCIVDKTDFGIVMTETEKNVLQIGLRSRSDIDVSKLAEELGGGGHKMAAGGILKDMPFEKAVEKVLETAKKYAKRN